MNTTLTRKEREVKQREQLILDVAREMLLERGYLGMTMDRIAEACEYSKGTVYGHFQNKEEVIAALAVATMDRRTAMFARAATFRGTSRERMTAIGQAIEIWVKLYPHDFRALTIIQSNSVREKASQARQQALQACDQRCQSIVTGIIRDALAQGDLTMRKNMTAEQLMFGLWSLTYGGYVLIASDIPLVELGVESPYRAVQLNGQALMDGFGWTPFAKDWDFDETVRRIQTEVFSDEIRQLLDS